MNPEAEVCYHCSLTIPKGAEFSTVVEGEKRYFCCPGCQAVAETIIHSGLDGFYKYRFQASQRPDFETEIQNYLAYDLPQLQSEFVTTVVDQNGESMLQAQFLVEGITCAACVWLIEHHLAAIDGIVLARVNAATGRATLQWQPARLALSKILSAVAAIGYRLSPATEDRQHVLQQKERRLALMRIGVAGFGMMQVGMVAVTIYAGAAGEWLTYWRWISLIIATPVVFFSARPFFAAASRALRNRHLVMDVPVSLAIAFAYSASVWATLSNSGEVYFDSVSMFTFFLLLGRYLEMSTRHQNQFGMTRLAQLLPLTATRISCDGSSEAREVVPVRALAVGDQVVVAAGETIPCDGIVVAGSSRVDEALLTGESHAIEKTAASSVVAGSNNLDSALTITVGATGKGTALSAIERLVESAAAHKPRQVALADRLASWFVGAVLVVATLTALYWYFRQPEHALWVVLSVLVVTCPCALSLATPTAHAAALTRLRRGGLLVINSDVFAALARVTCIVFDKTGTLTEGEPQVTQIVVPGDTSEQFVLEVIAALEQDNRHPIARAFRPWSGAQLAVDRVAVPSAGVTGLVGGTRYYFGHSGYIAESTRSQPEVNLLPEGQFSWMALATDDNLVAWVGLSDSVRQSAAAAVKMAQEIGIDCILLSGDLEQAVTDVAQQLGLRDASGRVTPEQKLARVQQLQAAGEIVLMVGDGINDVPVLSGADISVAMASATDLAQTKADALLLAGDLTLLVSSHRFAQKLQTAIKQNLAWALGYNGLALPLAIMGLVPPWAAAIGMSVSSLVVVANALRLTRVPL